MSKQITTVSNQHLILSDQIHHTGRALSHQLQKGNEEQLQQMSHNQRLMSDQLQQQMPQNEQLTSEQIQQVNAQPLQQMPQNQRLTNEKTQQGNEELSLVILEPNRTNSNPMKDNQK